MIFGIQMHLVLNNPVPPRLKLALAAGVNAVIAAIALEFLGMSYKTNVLTAFYVSAAIGSLILITSLIALAVLRGVRA